MAKEKDTNNITRIFIFNSNGDVLFQYRSSKEDSFPNTWDQSAGGHVKVGETFEEAALRELREEVGISGVSLYFVKYFDTPKRKNAVFMGKYDGKIKLQLEEVEKVAWMPYWRARLIAKFIPKFFTPSVRDILLSNELKKHKS